MRAALEARAPETRGWAGRRVVTPVEGAGDYYIAEAYHQQYLSKGGRFGLAQSAEKGARARVRVSPICAALAPRLWRPCWL